MAEMTGRRARVVKTDKQPQPHYEVRESDNSSVDSLNIQEVRTSEASVCRIPSNSFPRSMFSWAVARTRLKGNIVVDSATAVKFRTQRQNRTGTIHFASKTMQLPHVEQQ